MKLSTIIHFTLLLAATAGGTACAQNYPARLIRMITAEAGGGADYLTRHVAQELSKSVSQQVIVENRAGNPVVVVSPLLKAPPDGYLLLMYSDSMWILPFMQDVPYDPLKDFTPITLGAYAPVVLCVHPSMPVHSVKELIALAKANPGKLNYSMASAGSSTQMAPELFKALAGLNILAVPYGGAQPSLNAVLGGETNMAFPVAASVMPFLNSPEKLRILAVTSLEPSPLLPGVPTLASQGFPGFEAGAVYGFFAPAGTPKAIVDKLNHEIVQIVKSQDTKDRLYKLGLDATGTTSEQMAAAMKSQMNKWGKLIKDANLRPKS